QMFLSRVRRFETERARDFRTSRRHTVFGNGVLNEPEYLSLTGCEIGHASTCICSQLLSLYTVSKRWQVGRWQGNLREPKNCPKPSFSPEINVKTTRGQVQGSSIGHGPPHQPPRLSERNRHGTY